MTEVSVEFRGADSHWWGGVVALANNRLFQLITLMTFALVLNREGDRVPRGNEWIYLLYFWKGWHRAFLATDWTFQEPTAGHAVFNYTVGWMARLMSLEAAAWVGRVCSWAIMFIGLLRLGRHFKIQPWAIWVGILLWLMERQSPVTSEWMIGSFEAKCIGYTCLLFAIDAVACGKILRGGVLCGTAFSFHSAVGMWAGTALGVAVLLRAPIKQTIQFSIVVILFSLPGLLTSLPLIAGEHAISAADARFMVTMALPLCFDPFFFPKTWLVVLGAIAVFAVTYARQLRAGDRLGTLLTFEIVTAVFFFAAVAARAVGWFNFVELFPMRVYAVFALLFFFWQLASMIPGIALSNERKGSLPLLVFGITLLLSVPSPMLMLRDMVMSHLSRFQNMSTAKSSITRYDDTSFQTAATWIATHTPETDVVIAPPWRADGFYTIRRPLIANWHAPRYDAMTEWRERIESLVGDLSHSDPAEVVADDMGTQARTHYEQLSPADIAQIRKKYGGKWLLTSGRYSYPLMFSNSEYSVYQLP